MTAFCFRLSKLLSRSTARTQADYGEVLNRLSDMPASAKAMRYLAKDPPSPGTAWCAHTVGLTNRKIARTLLWAGAVLWRVPLTANQQNISLLLVRYDEKDSSRTHQTSARPADRDCVVSECSVLTHGDGHGGST
jgi:hypothetical protein